MMSMRPDFHMLRLSAREAEAAGDLESAVQILEARVRVGDEEDCFGENTEERGLAPLLHLATRLDLARLKLKQGRDNEASEILSEAALFINKASGRKAAKAKKSYALHHIYAQLGSLLEVS